MSASAASLDWLFALDPDKGGLERQIYRQIREAILGRRLAPGTRLPPSRRLAENLKVSRGTVVAAFDQLVAEGYLEARTGRGTSVAPLPDELLGESAGPARPKPSLPMPSRRAAHFSIMRTDGAIEPKCFKTGVPSLADFPRREWARCLAARARTMRSTELAYDNASGLPALKRAIVTHINRSRGVVADPDQVVVIPSAQAGFTIAALCTADPGDVMAIEDPGYRNARAIFMALGGEVAPIPVDADGISVAALAALKDFRLVAVTPSHQYPTGVTMSVDRRLRLLDLVRSRKAFVLEDDYDSEFRYFERPIASLQGLDGGANVIYLGTFSKCLAPGLRTAYLVLPPSLIDAARRCAPGLGQVVPAPVQAALADFIDEGYLAAHIGRMRNLYAEKSHVLSESLRRALHESCVVPAPRGGLQLLVGLPDEADDQLLVDRLAGAGIETQALSSLSMKAAGKGLLLGFAGPRAQEIPPAVRRLANIVNRHVAAIGHG